MKTSFPLALVLALAISFGGFTHAASLIRQQVIFDGTSNPPGDRIDLEILFRPGEQPVTVEVRAFTVEEQVAKPVRARRRQNRDANGNLVVSAILMPGDSPIVKSSINVPYADIALDLGTHRFGYEISGTQGDKAVFVRATELSTVDITNQPRTTMTQQIAVPIASTFVRPLTVFSVQGNQITESVIEQQSAGEPQMVFEARTVNVDIPNGFKRRTTRSIAFVNVVDDPIRAQAEELKQKGWVPVRHKTIYFATNRNVVNPNLRSPERFGNSLSPILSYGSCLVNIPTEQAHERGRLETPGWWGANPDKHFLIETLNTLGPGDFYRTAASVLSDATDPRDVLLFVHGFNNTFEFVMLRAAQVVHDVRFPGSTIVFSWPSQGAVNGYRTDETHAAASVAALTSVFNRLAAQRRTLGANSARKIHVIAHSMGNRILLDALQQFAPTLPPDERPFGHIVLAAPDVGVSDFVARIPSAVRAAEDVTLYFCEEDKALTGSRQLHNTKRAGEGLVTLQALLNVDAAKANTSLLGHDYFASNSLLLIDLDMLINTNVPPANRQTIRSRLQPVLGMNYQYWVFP